MVPAAASDGSRDEVEAGKSGYAHLFEHLMFRGTDNVPAEEYLKRLQMLGAGGVVMSRGANTSTGWTASVAVA